MGEVAVAGIGSVAFGVPSALISRHKDSLSAPTVGEPFTGVPFGSDYIAAEEQFRQHHMLAASATTGQATGTENAKLKYNDKRYEEREMAK